jgi:hypothetical protein
MNDPAPVPVFVVVFVTVRIITLSRTVSLLVVNERTVPTDVPAQLRTTAW